MNDRPNITADPKVMTGITFLAFVKWVGSANLSSNRHDIFH